MPFDIIKFLEDYDIQYHTHGKNISTNGDWIGLNCPRCINDPSTHLGACISTGSFVCWRCGYMDRIEAVKRLTDKSWTIAKQIVKDYGDVKSYYRHKKTAKEKDIDVDFPKGTLNYFPDRHRKYLEDRDFDADHLIDLWDLHATGKGGAYKNRIIAPIYYRNILMSYQGRDITDKSSMRYKACATEYEKRHHKHCLYGLDMAVGNAVLVVEGITDVWRMGIGSVATFGTRYTEGQVLLLYYYFDRIFVYFDETEGESLQHGANLVQQLCTLGKDAEQITLGIESDPGDLNDKEARHIMRELLIK